jgi:FkbM family methyltransferase
LKIVTALLPKECYLVTARLKNGMKIMVDPHDFDGREILLFGVIDPEIIDICKKLLSEGDIFLDIGANYGSVGLNCAAALGKSGSVHFFEPQPDLCKRLRQCLALYPNVDAFVHEVGLMNCDGEMELQRNPSHSGASTFFDRSASTGDKTTVKVVDITTYIPPIVKEQPFAAKMDVEGSELLLLPWLVKQNNLRFLVFESLHIPDKENMFEIINDGGGLAIYGISRRASSIGLEPVICPTDFNLFKDVIVFHKNFIPEVEKHFDLPPYAV